MVIEELPESKLEEMGWPWAADSLVASLSWRPTMESSRAGWEPWGFYLSTMGLTAGLEEEGGEISVSAGG